MAKTHHTQDRLHPALNLENLDKVSRELRKQAAVPLVPLLVHGGLTLGSFAVPKLWRMLGGGAKRTLRPKPGFKPIPRMSAVAPNKQLNAPPGTLGKVSSYRLRPFEASNAAGKGNAAALAELCKSVDERFKGLL